MIEFETQTFPELEDDDEDVEVVGFKDVEEVEVDGRRTEANDKNDVVDDGSAFEVDEDDLVASAFGSKACTEYGSPCVVLGSLLWFSDALDDALFVPFRSPTARLSA